jgi:hypothetical protein
MIIHTKYRHKLILILFLSMPFNLNSHSFFKNINIEKIKKTDFFNNISNKLESTTLKLDNLQKKYKVFERLNNVIPTRIKTPLKFALPITVSTAMISNFLLKKAMQKQKKIINEYIEDMPKETQRWLNSQKFPSIPKKRKDFFMGELFGGLAEIFEIKDTTEIDLTYNPSLMRFISDNFTNLPFNMKNLPNPLFNYEKLICIAYDKYLKLYKKYYPKVAEIVNKCIDNGNFLISEKIEKDIDLIEEKIIKETESFLKNIPNLEEVTKNYSNIYRHNHTWLFEKEYIVDKIIREYIVYIRICEYNKKTSLGLEAGVVSYRNKPLVIVSLDGMYFKKNSVLDRLAFLDTDNKSNTPKFRTGYAFELFHSILDREKSFRMFSKEEINEFKVFILETYKKTKMLYKKLEQNIKNENKANIGAAKIIFSNLQKSINALESFSTNERNKQNEDNKKKINELANLLEELKGLRELEEIKKNSNFKDFNQTPNKSFFNKAKLKIRKMLNKNIENPSQEKILDAIGLLIKNNVLDIAYLILNKKIAKRILREPFSIFNFEVNVF